jgi:OmpA-OmpF porin, OOP family
MTSGTGASRARNRRILAAMTPCARVALAAATLLALAPAARADNRFELGGFFGPRVFSNDAQLGNVVDVNDTLTNAVALGVRVSRPVFPWFVVEAELPIATTQTHQYMTDVYWLEPRAQGRVVFFAKERAHPFVMIGAGMPVTISDKRGIFGSGVTGEGYAGGGFELKSAHGIALRLDVRVGIQPGIDHKVEPELEFTAGLSFPIGKSEAQKRKEQAPPPPPPDRDGDGIVDALDKCPDRAEDKDNFEDDDGCPDIDNDGDEVLDIADACPNIPETFNGFEDDDGCPDTVPEDVDAIRGTVEGLIYGPGEIDVRPSADKALDRIAQTMLKHPSIKVLATGYTDDREALPRPPPPDADVAALSVDLSEQRAEAVKAELVKRGVQDGRVEVVARGAEDAVDTNDTGRGRLHNRRVEVKFFVPKRN